MYICVSKIDLEFSYLKDIIRKISEDISQNHYSYVCFYEDSMHVCMNICVCVYVRIIGGNVCMFMCILIYVCVYMCVCV